MRKSLFFLFLVSVIIYFTGCYYDNFQELYPASALLKCDTSSTITYSKHIAPLMQSYCVSCHETATSQNKNVGLNNYNDVKNAASGTLMKALTHAAGATPMPNGSGVKISDCYITQIQKWIDAGTPNN